LVQVPPAPPYQLSAMASPPAAQQTVLAASTSALYRSTDGGDLWTQVAAGVPANVDVTRLQPAASDPSVVYAVLYANPAGPGAQTSLGTYKSVDAGISWAASNPPSGPIPYLLAVDPSAANVLYGSTATALLKSSDGGGTWSPLLWDPAVPNSGVGTLVFDPVHTNILYSSGGNGRIARSVDRGASWETLRAPNTWPLWGPTSMIADPKRPENLLVGTYGFGVQKLTVEPDLKLSVVAPPNPVAMGVAAAYVYTVANLGPFDATGVRVNLQLPSTAQSVSVTAAGGTCSVASSLAACTFPVLRTGSSAALALNATAPAVGSFPVVGTVAGDQPDSDPTNNAVTSMATVAMLADVSVKATGSATAHVGDTVSYTLNVTNAGPNVASATQLTYQLAVGLTPGAVTSSGATCATSGTALITCDLNSVAVATSVTITVDATAAAAGTQISTAAVASGATDPGKSNNSATTTTTVAAVSPPVTPPATSGKGGGGAQSLWDALVLVLLLTVRIIRQVEADRSSPCRHTAQVHPYHFPDMTVRVLEAAAKHETMILRRVDVGNASSLAGSIRRCIDGIATVAR
jgi:uncharacterized repeat protein (TIGR01451 family)